MTFQNANSRTKIHHILNKDAIKNPLSHTSPEKNDCELKKG